jgi:polygalacturonase
MVMSLSHFFIWGLICISCVNAQPAEKIPLVKLPSFRKDTVSILQFKAVGDGVTLNTRSIRDAIQYMSKKGGGVVLVPSGIWLTGPIRLENNINLYLGNGATIMFTRDFNQYPLVEGNWEGIPQMRNQSPISAVGVSNLAITGKGIIDGNGDAWRMVKKDKLNPSQWKRLLASGGVLSDDGNTWYPTAKSLKGSRNPNAGAISPEKKPAYFDSIKDFLRPNLLLLEKCSVILIEGVTFQNSPAWCLHPLMSGHLTVRDIKVKNPWYAQNGDGIDVESCKNVLIENSTFDVGDDGICLKSGRDAEGRKRGMPTKDVTIKGCIVYASHGGFVIGSEMSGGITNIHVSNCTFIGTDIGLRFKTARGRGGVVENIIIQDIYMKDIQGEAIIFDMYYAAKDPVPLVGEKRELPAVEFKQVDESTPVFRNIHISNIYCAGAEKAIYIRGLPEMHVKDIVMENMVLQANTGIEVQEATGIIFRKINIIAKGSNPLIDVLQSENLLFDQINYADNVELLFRISGDRSHQINIGKTDASRAKKKISFELGATDKSLF